MNNSYDYDRGTPKMAQQFRKLGWLVFFSQRELVPLYVEVGRVSEDVGCQKGVGGCSYLMYIAC